MTAGRDSSPPMTDPYALPENVTRAINALDPDQPVQAGDPRFVDLDAARGTSGLLKLGRALVAGAEDRRYTRFALCAHRGVGKTSALLRLQSELQSRFHPLYLAANVEMDAVKFQFEDLLVLLCRQIISGAEEKGATPFDPGLLKRVHGYFTQVVREHEETRVFASEVKGEASAGATVPGLAKLLTSVSNAFKVESKTRETLRETLAKYPGQLIDAANSLLDAVERSAKRPVLVILDNLDRYNPKMVDELLLANGDRFERIHASFVVTPPISMAYRPGHDSGYLADHFEPVVIPNIKFFAKDGPRPAPGSTVPLRTEAVAALREVVKKRNVDPTLFPDDAALQRLMLASGGAMRDYIRLLQSALTEAGGPVGAVTVDKLVRKQRSALFHQASQNGWVIPLLALARTRRVVDDAKTKEALHNRLAFEYNDDGWFDVHPLLYEHADFDHDLKALGPQAG